MIDSGSPFKRVRAKGPQQLDIEALFKDLKNRSPDIRDLFAHQADILRDYYNSHLQSHDVSLELPTGSGKTLVGLLIAEYRRKIIGQRVLYLCPTKQLAHQVGRHSKDYGIETRVFVGTKRKYNSSNLLLYRSAKAIAVSTYSSLFNTNPGIDDPQTIILDDAHSAETYIGSMWSVAIDRIANAELYSRIVQLFERDLPSHFIAAVQQSSRPRIPLKTEKVPFGAFHRSISALRDILDKAIPSADVSQLYFPWITIRDGLNACHVYVSYDSILIRPYIPPTQTHPPFARADQRIYMSATLGRGGELERITGVKEIKRIPTPKTYLSRGIGRRLFLFPDFANDPDEYSRWIAHRLSSVERTLGLCPNEYEERHFRQIAELCSPKLRILGAEDIEESMESFIESERSLLLLKNRYDGIDLPHGVCRQVILDGLPSKTNLQEAFLEDRLGLEVLLKERIKTRIEQASGRCTRSDTDRAAIIMLGRRLLDFCLRNENQRIFHPEMRAEMRFALEQQSGTSGLDAMLNSFMTKDANWDSAEQDIADLRSSEDLPDTMVTDVLAGVVKNEVDFAYSLWSGDYEKAVSYGRAVVDGLSGNRVAPYRALWCYFVAAAAYAAAESNKTYAPVVIDFLDRAKEACRTISWLSYALKSMSQGRSLTEETTELQAIAVEEVVDTLKSLGSTGPRFQRKMDEIERLLQAKEPKDFDVGLVGLGELLGFNSWKPSGTAPPDCVWQLGSRLLFVFETKSIDSPSGSVSVQDCRQASGHLNWAAAQNDIKDIKESFSMLVTAKSKIDRDAVAHAGKLNFLANSDVFRLFEKVKSMLLEARGSMTDINLDELGEKLLQIMLRMSLAPENIRSIMTLNPVSGLPVNE